MAIHFFFKSNTFYDQGHEDETAESSIIAQEL